MEKIKKEILEKLKKTYCRIQPSSIEGVGVFAVRNISKNVNPFFGIIDKKWHKFEMSELKKLDKGVLKMIDDFFVIEKDGSVYVPKDGLNGIDVSFFVNTSKNPNLKIIGSGKELAVSFVTIKNIKRGEELTVDYATYDDKYK